MTDSLPYDFSSGNTNPETYPGEELAAAAARVIPGLAASLNTYPGKLGHEGLRRLLAERESAREGVEVDPDHIVLTNGSMQGVTLVAETFCEGSGDRVLLEELTYNGTIEAYRSLGIEMVGVPVDGNGMRTDRLAELLDEMVREGRPPRFIYTLATYQNPTGAMMPRARRAELLAAARCHGCLVVEDNGYETDAETGRRSWRALGKGCYTTIGGSWAPKSDAAWRNPGFPQGSDHPVTCISWFDAAEFCRWLSAKTERTVRLPTEGELEYGQRALTVTRYYWGKRPADYVRDPRLPIGYWANVADAARGDNADADLFLTGTEMRSLTPEGRDDGYGHTAPVGKYYPNPRGLYDAIGNVWEYTLDWAGEDPARTDPRGPDEGGVRSMRGGSWLNSPDAYRPSYRPEIDPAGRTSTRGMRVLVEE